MASPTRTGDRQLEVRIITPERIAFQQKVDAVVATGVRRVEVTSFVSPKAVPALADAADVVAELGRWPEVLFSALVAGPGRLDDLVGECDLERLRIELDRHLLAAGHVGEVAVDLLEYGPGEVRRRLSHRTLPRVP